MIFHRKGIQRPISNEKTICALSTTCTGICFRCILIGVILIQLNLYRSSSYSENDFYVPIHPKRNFICIKLNQYKFNYDPFSSLRVLYI